jgi:hypothetical protein
MIQLPSYNGYVLEVICYETILAILFLHGSFQILYSWRLPQNRSRVKEIQIWFGSAGLLGSIVGILIFLDSKCHFGYYDDWVLCLYVVILLWLFVPPIFVWLKFAYQTASVFAYGEVTYHISNSVIHFASIVNIGVTSLIFGLALKMDSIRIMTILSIWFIAFSFFELVGLIIVKVILSKTDMSKIKGREAVEHHQSLQRKLLVCIFVTVLYMPIVVSCNIALYHLGVFSLRNDCNQAVSIPYKDLPIAFKLFSLFIFLSICIGVCFAYVMAYISPRPKFENRKAHANLRDERKHFMGDSLQFTQPLEQSPPLISLKDSQKLLESLDLSHNVAESANNGLTTLSDNKVKTVL